jgi:hypothetical protein
MARDLIIDLVTCYIGGANVGILFQRMVPETVVLLLTMVTLSFAFYITIRKFAQLYKFETLDFEYNARFGSSIGLGLVTDSQYAESEYDEFETLMNEEYDNKVSAYEGRYTNDESTPTSSSSSSNIYIKESADPHGLSAMPPSRTYRFPWLILQVIVAVWVIYFSTYIISRRDRICSSGYFTMVLALYPCLLGEMVWGMWYVKLLQQSDEYVVAKGDVNFSRLSMWYYCFFSFCAGILCTLLGLGGGELLGPLILSMHVLPQVSSATTSVISFLNSVSNVIYYFSKGKIPLANGLICFLVGISAGVAGRMLAFYQSKSTGGRPSVLVLCLTLILAISFGMNFYSLVTSSLDFTFRTLCH